MDQTDFNRKAWDAIATSHRKWFFPVTPEEIAEARKGILKIKVTATKNLPAEWLGNVSGKRILCLAAGGGHQGPLLAAAGADVTVADFSDGQLAIDREVASREELSLRTVQCDMRQLGDLDDFDIVLNPCSVNFCSNVPKVWREAFRVLRPGGALVTGFILPVNYIFDANELLEGRFVAKHSIPYAGAAIDIDTLGNPDTPPTPVEFGHSLTNLIGSQLSAGFRLTGFFEDRWGADDPLSDRIAVFAATRAMKPS